MKKLIFILIAVFAVMFSHAQIIGTAVSFNQDTTTNTEVEYLEVPSAKAIVGNYAVGISITPVNISGTATVTAALQFSHDNSVWHDYGTATTVNTAGTVANWSWILADMPFKYVRVKCSSTGTGATKLNGKLIIKRKT